MNFNNQIIRRQLGFTPEVNQAFELVKTNRLINSPSSKSQVSKMVTATFKNRHKLGLDFSLKRINIFKLVLQIINQK